MNEGLPNQWTEECIDLSIWDPGRDHQIFDYIFRAQISTIFTMNAWKFFVAPHLDSDENHGIWSWQEDFPHIMEAIDQGKYPLLGLRASKVNGLFDGGHQVLAIGYDSDGLVFVYDPNHPNETYAFKRSGISHEYGTWDGAAFNRTYEPNFTYRSFFVMADLDTSQTANRNGFDILTDSSLNWAVKPNYIEMPVAINYFENHPDLKEMIDKQQKKWITQHWPSNPNP